MIRLRHRLRPLAATLLVWLGVAAGWSSLVHGADCHDADCAAAAVAHDASAHAFTSPRPGAPAQADHCFLCHAARTFRPPVTSTHVLPAAAGQDVRVPIAARRIVRGSIAAQPPLRSPPTAALA
jgi:hypothetical protein